METVAAWALRLLDEHTELALFLVLLLEESGVPLPLPGDLVMMLAGVRIGQGRVHPLVAILLMESATWLGASFLYTLARRGGRPALYRYGRFLHLEVHKLARAEDFLRRHGWLAITLGRVIPGLRIPTTLVAGVFGVPYRVFLPALVLGASAYLGFFTLLGYVAGPGIIAAIEGPHLSARFVAIVAGLAVVVAAFAAIRRRAHLVSAQHVLPERFRLETALLAGLLATATAALAIDFLLYGLVAFDQLTPITALLHLGHAIGQRVGARPRLVLIAGITLYVLLQLLWAVLYAHVERWLPEPDWLGGLLFALAPLAVSLFGVLPALGAGPAGLGLGMGLIPLVGEVVRHAVYGWALAVSYTLLSRARAAARAAAGAGGEAPER